MNTTLKITSVLLLVIFAIFGSYFLFFVPTQEVHTEENGSNSSNSENSDNTDKVLQFGESDDKPLKTPAPENAMLYKLQEGSEARYVVQKRFFKKPDEQVVGITKGVEGTAWYDPENKSFYLTADVDLSGLATDKPKRDADILPLFTSTKAAVVISPANTLDKVTLGENFQTTVNAQLTINNITKQVNFAVNGLASETGFTAEGKTTVDMSDFGVVPPSMLNVFSVDDEVELQFSVVGEKTY